MSNKFKLLALLAIAFASAYAQNGDIYNPAVIGQASRNQKVAKSLQVVDTATLNGVVYITRGAGNNKILTSDANGKMSLKNTLSIDSGNFYFINVTRVDVDTIRVDTGNIAPGSTLVVDGNGTLIGAAGCRCGLQDVITNDSTLTKDNIIKVDGYRYFLDSVGPNSGWFAISNMSYGELKYTEDETYILHGIDTFGGNVLHIEPADFHFEINNHLATVDYTMDSTGFYLSIKDTKSVNLGTNSIPWDTIFTKRIKITTGAGANKVLMSDAAGNATWQPLGYVNADSVTIYALAPAAGTTYYCTNCSGDGITGRIVSYIGAAWRRLKFD